MRESDNQPQRLGLGKVDPSSREARAGDFLREALDVAELSDAEIANIRVRLAASASGRRPRRPLVPAFAAFGILLVAGGGLAALGTFQRRPAPTTPILRPSRAPQARAQAVEPALIPPPPVEAPPVATPLPETPQPLARASRRASESHLLVARSAGDTEMHASGAPAPAMEPAPAPPADRAAAHPSAAGAEARSLAEALERWRRQGQADAALSLLDEHDRRFPRGLLHVEARVARAEILLALGRTLPALGVLDGLNLSGLPRARELGALRGDLRVQAGRCADARADLNAVLKRGRDDELGRRAERALQLCP